MTRGRSPGADDHVETAGHHALADDRARGLSPDPQAVHHVRFPAADLFGAGEHTVTVELWEDYLEPIDDGAVS